MESSTIIEYTEAEAIEQEARLKAYEHYGHLDIVKVEVRPGVFNVILVQRKDNDVD